MHYSSNIENSSYSSITKSHLFNSVSGGSGTVATPDQLGINITKSIFGWQSPGRGPATSNKAPSGGNTAANEWIDTYGMPFIFVVNGNQILLPPVVQAGGTPVPYLPDGLSVIYASNFMGVPIPSDFFKPIAANGKLRLDKTEMQSVMGKYPNIAKCAGGSASSALLRSNCVNTGLNQGNTLLYLLMSVMECLIYSYSSDPWGNGYDDLSNTVMTKRDLDNWIMYPYGKGTFLGNVVKAVAPVYTAIATVGGAVLTVVNPAVGAALIGSGQLLKKAEQNSNKAATNKLGAGLYTQEINPGTVYDPSGNVLQASGPLSPAVSGSSSTLIIIVLVAIVVIIIIVVA